MYKDNQERVDAYLRGEMDNESRTQFERDLETDKSLSNLYRETKAISDAIADRKVKLDQMSHWDKVEEIEEQLIRRRRNIRNWTIGIGAAACIAVGFFAVGPLFRTNSYSPSTDLALPSSETTAYYRGGDSSMEYLDSLITILDYEKALAYADSLIQDYNRELMQYEAKHSLTEKEAFDKEVLESELQDIEWQRAKALIALGKTKEAKACLKKIIKTGGPYRKQADSLINTLKD